MKNNSKRKKKKQPFNMFAWGQKNKKKFAGAICAILALAMIISLLQF